MQGDPCLASRDVSSRWWRSSACSTPTSARRTPRSTSSSTGASRGRRRCSCCPRRRATSPQEKLDVTIDAGSGSGNAVNRVASGTYQMGFADLAALIEFVGNNPTAPNKPVAVMMVYDATPAAVFSLKKTDIKTPADLQGKKMGAPVFDAGRRAFPIFVEGEQARRRQDRVDGDGPAAARDDAGQGRRRRDHRLLLHEPPQPQRARREGRGHRRDDVSRSTASTCTATRSSSPSSS